MFASNTEIELPATMNHIERFKENQIKQVSSWVKLFVYIMVITQFHLAEKKYTVSTKKTEMLI